MVSKHYIPERGDVVWLDFEPSKGKEFGKYRPAFVLSSLGYNKKTGLLICCPISTNIRGGLTEVPILGLEQPSVIAAGIIQTLSWQDRKVKYIVRAESQILTAVLDRVFPLIGAEHYFT